MTRDNDTRPRNGDEVKDLVTGFTGIVTSVTEFLNGCRRVCVCPPAKEDNTFQDERWFDDGQIEVVQRGKVRSNPAIPEPAPEAAQDMPRRGEPAKGGDRPDHPRR